jgi:prepilin peptidase CpaA
MFTEYALLLLIAGLLSHLAHQDFWHLKLPNPSIAALLLAVLGYIWIKYYPSWQPNLIAGGILFIMGIVFWLFGLMGAGDAKLMLPLGILIGIAGFLVFAIALIAYTLLLLIIIKLAKHLRNAQQTTLHRLYTIAEQGKVPFGIPLIAATATVVVIQITG